MRRYQAKDDELRIFKQALGVMEDWRSSLQFLSQLTRIESITTVDGREQRVNLVALDAPRPEIIDACYREVLKGKGPGLGHRMIAMLAGALRADLLLTTNFEDLIERGFAVSRNTLEVCEVQLGGDLPQWAAVADCRTLHQAAWQPARSAADYTLEAAPSEADRRCFLEYLRAQRHDVETSIATDLDFRNHLLVIGHSLSERRTRGLSSMPGAT